MTEKVPPPIEHKEVKLLNDRIILSTREILFRDIETFDIETNNAVTLRYFFIGFIAALIALGVTIGFLGIFYALCYYIVPLGLAFTISENYGKMNLRFFLKDGTNEIIHSTGLRSIVVQLQEVWKNHDPNKLKQLNIWANKEIEALNKSLSESKKKSNEQDLPIDFKLIKWNNQYIQRTLKLRTIFNVK